MSGFRWDRCIHHRGQEAVIFIDEFFSGSHRSVLVVGGAGFDPRSYHVTERLAGICRGRLSGFFIREERPGRSEGLLSLADNNDARIREFIPPVNIRRVDIFDADNAPVGGRRTTRLLAEFVDLAGVTDVVLDCSALSVGVMFPIARYCLEAVVRRGTDVNLHIFVLDAPSIDSAVKSTSCGKAGPLHTFSGGLALDSSTDAARLWLPQLGP